MKQVASRASDLRKRGIMWKEKGSWEPIHQFPLDLSENQDAPVRDKRKFCPWNGWLCRYEGTGREVLGVSVVVREPRRVGQNSSAWVLGMRGEGGRKSKNGRGRSGKEGLGLMGARRGQGLCPGKGSVHTPSWPSGEANWRILWRRLPTNFQGAGERFSWLVKAESILPVVMVLNLSRLPDETSVYLALVERMLTLWDWVQYPKLIIYFATADLAGCCSRISRWCSFNLVSIELSLYSARQNCTQKECCILPVSSVPGRPWLIKGSQRFSSAGVQPTWYCGGIAPF
jgi:hypothetical protein